MPKKIKLRKIAFLQFTKIGLTEFFMFSLFCKKNNAQKIIGVTVLILHLCSKIHRF